jgi:hypothetical protein
MPEDGPTNPGFSPESDIYPCPAENIPPDLPPAIAERVVKGEYRYANIVAVIGGIAVIAGLAMILLGVAGSVDLDFDIGSTKLHIKTAVVGVVIAALGVIAIIFARPHLSWAKKDASEG